jgi:glycine cleavage system H lipoate-binding protein
LSQVGLAPCHPILRLGLTVESVTYCKNFLQSKAQGKKKKGAAKMDDKTVVCEAKCSNGQTYRLRSCVRGSLLEANERLVSDPSLLITMPQTDGYVAIVLPAVGKRELARLREAPFISKDKYSALRQGVEKKHVQTLFGSSGRENIDETKL